MDITKTPKEVTIVDVVVAEPNKLQPILVNFQHGKLTDAGLEEMKCGIYRDEKDKTMLAMSNGRIIHKGYKLEPDEEEEMQIMVGIYNKKTNSVKLITCDRWDVCPVLDIKSERRTDFHEDTVKAVNKEYGSKRLKRRTEQYEKLKINVESITEQLENIASGFELQQEDLSNKVNDDFTTNIIPSCNRDASKVSDVYSLAEIIPASILKALGSLVNEVIEEGYAEEKPFFKSLFPVAQRSVDPQKDMAILIYLAAVCKWLEVSIKDARKIGFIKENYKLPHDVAIHILESYTVASTTGRQRPPIIRDKAIVHCMILGLMINNYDINLEELSRSLNIRIGIKKLSDLARSIYLTPNRQKKNVFSLKLPLPASVAPVKKIGKRK